MKKNSSSTDVITKCVLQCCDRFVKTRPRAKHIPMVPHNVSPLVWWIKCTLQWKTFSFGGRCSENLYASGELRDAPLSSKFVHRDQKFNFFYLALGVRVSSWKINLQKLLRQIKIFQQNNFLDSICLFDEAWHGFSSYKNKKLCWKLISKELIRLRFLKQQNSCDLFDCDELELLIAQLKSSLIDVCIENSSNQLPTQNRLCYQRKFSEIN